MTDYLSRVQVTATAGQTSFTVDFEDGLIDIGSSEDTVEVYVNSALELGISVTWTSSTTLEISGSPVLLEGDIIEFRRVTPNTEMFVDFTAGSSLRTAPVDLNMRQLLHLTHMAQDQADAAYDASSGAARDEAVAAAAAATLDADRAEAAVNSVAHRFSSVASMVSYTLHQIGDIVQTTAYPSTQDGGMGVYRIVAAGTGTVDGWRYINLTGSSLQAELIDPDSHVDVRSAGALADGSDDSAAINVFDSISGYPIIKLPLGDYTVSSSILLRKISGIVGAGYTNAREGLGSPGYPKGTVITAGSTGVSNLLTVQTEGVSPESDYNQNNLVIENFALYHRGSGSGLIIDNIVQSHLKNIGVFCNNEGAVGIELTNWSFLSKLENVYVKNFTDVGIYVATDGSQTTIENPFLTAGVAANYGIETLNVNTIIRGGQVSITSGKNIYFHNVATSSVEGGLVYGTLFEAGVGIRIDGDTHQFKNVIVKNTRHTLGSGQTGIEFGPLAANCKMIDPSVNSPTGGTIAVWEAGSTNCGIIGGYDMGRAGMTVSASAIGAYVVIDEPIGYSQRANLTTDSNLTVTVEDCQYVGKTRHNGTAWDKFYYDMTDNSAVSITPPTDYGHIELYVEAAAGYALVSFSPNIIVADIVSQGVTVNLTSGTLSGTTGVDGEFTIRKDATSDDFYMENRLGATRAVIVKFVDRTRD
jgi:hypothetical protein